MHQRNPTHTYVYAHAQINASNICSKEKSGFNGCGISIRLLQNFIQHRQKLRR